LHGGGDPPDAPENLRALLENIRTAPDLLLTLTAAFDCRGGPYQFPREDTPQQRRLDLHVLQRLQLCPGDTRSARDLFARLPQAIPTLEGLCLFPQSTPNWPSWPAAAVAAYQRGLELSLPKAQSPEQMAAVKAASVAEIEAADHLYLRPHHVLCILCYYGGGRDLPLEVDNLWELLLKMKDNPEIPVTFVEGDCMVCAPCHGFDPASGCCVAGCGLKDRRKDLDTLQRLDMLLGDTMPAHALLRRYRERIPHPTMVCDFGEGNVIDWRTCGTCHSGAYERALDRMREWLQA